MNSPPTRNQWRFIVIGYLILAVGFSVVTGIVVSEVNRLNDTIHSTKQIQGQLATSVIHNSGAICLFALAPTKKEERRIVKSYLEGSFQISKLFGPECTQVALKAKKDIFNGSPLPPSLRDSAIIRNTTSSKETP